MIVGAGLAGMIAAHLLPRQEVYERGPALMNHKALLRFRSKAVSDATGIEFRAVTVRKGIWDNGEWAPATITNANAYALKVTGALVDRSIWDLAPVTRWIAPEDFYDRLVDGLGPRVHWNTPVLIEPGFNDEAVVNTSPMPSVLSQLGKSSAAEFVSAPIFVKRFRLIGADVHQTVYFPSLEHGLYRASITGALLICEFVKGFEGPWMDDVVKAFALERVLMAEVVESSAQAFGKILPIDEGIRRGLVVNLTAVHNIFSLGRFATWRNILLDDVVNDALVIKRLMSANDYERKVYYGKG